MTVLSLNRLHNQASFAVFQDVLDGPLLWPFTVCFVGCASVLLSLLWTGWAWRLAIDRPTARSLHARPTPRVGGWGVAPSIAVGLAWFSPQLIWVSALVFVLAAFCQIDDRRGLSAQARFLVQLVAVVAVCIVYPAALPWWSWPIVVIGLIWVTNLYNFMDGADGLAGGMAVIGFGVYAIVAWPLVPSLALGAACVSGAAGGFLLFNFPPARIFLGDAGSIPLGFLAGSIGLIGWSAHAWDWWFPAMLFLPFLLDATITLVRRLFHGHKFWIAHREHYYQRMIQMDGGHRRTICFWYVLMVTGAVLALWEQKLGRAGGLATARGFGLAWIVLLLTLGLWVDRRWARFNRPDDQL